MALKHRQESISGGNPVFQASHTSAGPCPAHVKLLVKSQSLTFAPQIPNLLTALAQANTLTALTKAKVNKAMRLPLANLPVMLMTHAAGTHTLDLVQV